MPTRSNDWGDRKSNTEPCPGQGCAGARGSDTDRAAGGGRGGGMALDNSVFELNFPHVDAKVNSQLKMLWIGCGTEDSLMGVNRQFRTWLKEKGVTSIVTGERGEKTLTRFGIEQSSAVTAVSDYLKRKTEEVFNPQKKIRRIYNFADSALFHRRRDPCHRPSFSTPGQVVYMHLSNFRPVKRVEDVIRIFAKAAQTVDAVLVMIGEGPTQRPARDLAAQLGVANRVRFLGNQQDVPSLMGCGDIFLFPSELESFGLAPLEAMACEMPVIASDSGGVPEVVVHGESGYLAPVGDVDRMAEYAIELGRSPELRAKMGTAGRKRAETVFTPEIAMEQYEALYKEVMNAAK